MGIGPSQAQRRIYFLATEEKYLHFSKLSRKTQMKMEEGIIRNARRTESEESLLLESADKNV